MTVVERHFFDQGKDGDFKEHPVKAWQLATESTASPLVELGKTVDDRVGDDVLIEEHPHQRLLHFLRVRLKSRTNNIDALLKTWKIQHTGYMYCMFNKYQVTCVTRTNIHVSTKVTRSVCTCSVHMYTQVRSKCRFTFNVDKK